MPGTAVATTSAAKKVQKAPFRYGTVRRRITIGQFPVTPTNSSSYAIPSITIPQVGMLSRVVVTYAGSYTMSGTPTTLNLLDGFDAMVGRAQVNLNNGSANIVDLSGVGINIINKNLSTRLPIKRGLQVTAGAHTFKLGFVLPVSANTRRQFEMGLVNLQAPELRATINLVFNSLGSIFTDPTQISLFTATATVAYEYFEIPDLNRFTLPPLTIVRTLEEAPQNIAATGLQLYQLPRLGTMFEYHAVLVHANVYDNVVNQLTEFAWRYNKNDTQYDVFIPEWETYEAELYGSAGGNPATAQATSLLFDSAISFDLFAADNRPWGGGDFRDAIDTEENTTTESLITVSSGFTINTAQTNALYHVRRVVQRIIQAPAPAGQ